MNSAVITALGGVSGFIGLMSLLAYAYLRTSLSAARQSISDIISGDARISTGETIGVLEKFQGNEARLKALALILNHDRKTAEQYLTKIKSNIDVHKLSAATAKSARWFSLVIGIVLLGIAAIALANSAFPQSPSLPPSLEAKPTPTRTNSFEEWWKKNPSSSSTSLR